MRILFIRHGESQANITREFSNHDNTKHPLTEKGVEQARALAEKLRDVNLTAIYSSPLLRARQTADILNAGRGLEIQITPALREHDAGALEGRADPDAWREYQTMFEAWVLKREFDARVPNGENFNELYARFAPFLQTLTQTYGATDANIALVGHGGIFHALLPAFLSNLAYEFCYQHLLGNAALVIAGQRDGALYCLEWDGVSPEQHAATRDA